MRLITISFRILVSPSTYTSSIFGVCITGTSHGLERTSFVTNTGTSVLDCQGRHAHDILAPSVVETE